MMVIETKTVYDKAVYRALYYNSFFKKKNPRTCFILMAVFYALILASASAEAVWLQYDMTDFFILWGIVGLSTAFVFTVFPFILYRQGTKHNGVVTVHFTFSDDEMKAETEANGMFTEHVSYHYTAFCSVMQTKRYLFLYPEKNRAFIVDCRALSSSESEILQSALQKSLGKLYHVCQY